MIADGLTKGKAPREPILALGSNARWIVKHDYAKWQPAKQVTGSST